MNEKIAVKQNSWRLLISLFIIALLIFTAVRWDYSAWISNQVDDAAKQAGIDLSYQDLGISGLGISLSDVIIRQQGKLPIALDEVTVSASLSALMSGALGADIEAQWLGNPISASLSRDNDLIHVSNIDAMVDISRVDNLNIPAKLSGLIHITGDITLDQAKNLPKQGAIHATWTKAMAGLAAPEFTLGDYDMDLNSAEDEAQPWQWTIAGGSGVALQGSGTILPSMPDPKQWLVNGMVDTNIDNSNPSLAMMMQSMMGSTQAKLRISGSLGAPRTDIVR